MFSKAIEAAVAKELPKADAAMSGQAAAGAVELCALCLSYLVRKGIAEKEDIIQQLRDLADQEEVDPLKQAMFSVALNRVEAM